VQSSSQNVTINKPTSSFVQAGCPYCRPTNRVKALEGILFNCLFSRITPVYAGSSNGKPLEINGARLFLYVPDDALAVTRPTVPSTEGIDLYST